MFIAPLALGIRDPLQVAEINATICSTVLAALSLYAARNTCHVAELKKQAPESAERVNDPPWPGAYRLTDEDLEPSDDARKRLIYVGMGVSAEGVGRDPRERGDRDGRIETVEIENARGDISVFKPPELHRAQHNAMTNEGPDIPKTTP